MSGYFHIIKRFPTATAMNLIGLVVAFTASYALWTQVEFATKFNHNIDDCEHVYRIELSGIMSGMEARQPVVCRPLAERIAKLPQVESIMLWDDYAGKAYLKKDKEYMQEQRCRLLGNGMEMLRPRMICGVDTFATYNDALLPASIAMKYFGETAVAGRVIPMLDGDIRVAGVYEDFPENCMFPNVIYMSLGNENEDSFEAWNYYGFVRLVPGTDLDELGVLCRQMVVELQLDGNDDPEERKAMEEEAEKYCKFTFNPLSECYFSGVDVHDKGNRGMIIVLELACLLLLIVAAINFANFTLAETPMRIKGINTRKVLGMTDTTLRLSMIGETVLTAMVAFGLSVVAIYLLSQMPWIGTMMVGSLSLGEHLPLLACLGVVAVVMGFVVGIYPAYYATSFPPALVLKGSFGLSPRGQMLRKVLVGVQLTVAFVMAIYIGVLFSQSHYIFNSDYGFAKDEIVFSDEVMPHEFFEKYRSEFENIPGVEAVDYAQMMPGVSDMMMNWGRGSNERYVQFTCMPVGWKFLRVMGIDIVEGRDFNEHDGDVYIVNEAFRKKYDWIEIDKPMTRNKDDIRIVGVCKDFRVFTTRHNSVGEPVALLVMGEYYSDWNSNNHVVARIGKNVDKVATIKRLNECLTGLMMEGMPEQTFRFMDDELQQSYEEELRFIRQVEAFSLICLIVTLVGVFCLTMFEAEYRRKEIGLRKVMGSSTADIVAMFCRSYARLIAIAFVVASPLAYGMAGQWLRNFAERTPMHWWIWLIALIAVSSVVIVTVVLQTLKTAMEKPVRSFSV